MNYLPSPPQSPLLLSSIEKATCGSCDKTLSSDWFCSDCHSRCDYCNRFLTDSEYCTRCWFFDNQKHRLIRKEYRQQQQQQQQQQQRQQNDSCQLYLYLTYQHYYMNQH